MFRAHRLTFVLFTVVIAAAIAMGVALTAQERALRRGTALAAERFDLIVAAPGSQTELLLNTVFLQPSAVELMLPEDVARILAEPRVHFAAPLAFGDSHDGAPLVGTTAALVEHLSGGLREGRLFAEVAEAVVGAANPLAIGARFSASHGHAPDAEGSMMQHGMEFTVVGRMKPTSSPWDRAIVVPVEANWLLHGLPHGHPRGSRRIGPPYSEADLPGVPAIVLRPESFPAAYGLRNKYRTTTTTAFFPAEVLLQLYGIMGDVRRTMSLMTVTTQSLVTLSIVVGVIALMSMYRQRFAVLRAIGAPRRFIFATVWLYLMAIIGLGAVIGLATGYALAQVISAILAAETGIVFSAEIDAAELLLVMAILVIAALLATIPAWRAYRQPLVPALRGE
jgi:putative ABC transport system permease protein